MCGIAGFMGKGDEAMLRSMIQEIQYRGPDDTGVFLGEGVGLAHVRLSILDLSSMGHQPMWNEAKTLAIVFNGEIYNFQELKKELSKKGRKFQSKTDTEVILHLYEVYGEECFSKLNGMFAVALYDAREKKLLLARDRAGEKPLYWGVFQGTLVFGSEIKALLKHPLVTQEIDPESFFHYLALEYVPTPKSIFRGIEKLSPATFLIYQNNNVQEQRFWSPHFTESSANEKENIIALDDALHKSVSSRLVADVPVGIFLSGGIDSSAIAYYAQKNSSQKIKTFSIGFEEKSFDESVFAEDVARHLDTDHHQLRITSQDALQVIPEIAASLDEPLADASIIPTFLLSRFTRERVKVALGGDGGDELFGGYPTFTAEKFVEIYSTLPISVRKTLEKFTFLLPASEKNFGLTFKLNKFFEGATHSVFRRHLVWLGSFAPKELSKLLSEERRNDLSSTSFSPYAKGEAHFEEPFLSHLSLENKIFWGYFRTYLMDNVLVKVDRASMKHALEVRSPFLDHSLVEKVFQMPVHMKTRGFQTKYILKKLMEDKLPEHIIHRKKKGFGIPLARWLKYELRGYCEELLSKENVEKGGFFNSAYVECLKEEHFTGKKDHRKKLWTLLSFEAWRQNFLQ